MKEFNFSTEKSERYKIGDYVFNDEFTYDEIVIMSCPNQQAELINILNAHMEEGSKLTGDMLFRDITFISQTLMKGFQANMEKQ